MATTDAKPLKKPIVGIRDLRLEHRDRVLVATGFVRNHPRLRDNGGRRIVTSAIVELNTLPREQATNGAMWLISFETQHTLYVNVGD